MTYLLLSWRAQVVINKGLFNNNIYKLFLTYAVKRPAGLINISIIYDCAIKARLTSADTNILLFAYSSSAAGRLLVYIIYTLPIYCLI